MSSSSSRDRVAEDTYESQNDQRLDDLHAKIRTIRGVTTDIHSDVEAQNLLLDDSVRYLAQHWKKKS
jgi:blocked-early-in-transport protein 1